MAILKIARMGHPVLKRVADPVPDPTDPEIRKLVADMIETMMDAPGIGLAAPQVRVAKRVVVFYVPEARARAARYGTENADGPHDGARDLTIMINPIIEPLSDDMLEGPESCLSLPGLRGQVKRYNHIRYSFTDLEGQSHSVEASGFHARVVQHECDHLDGMLYPMRMETLDSFGFIDEADRADPPICAPKNGVNDNND